MPILTPAHYTAFGAIIHAYASTEFGIKATLAGLLEIPFVEALIVTEPYSSASLRNVAKSIVKESTLSDALKQQFVQAVGDWGAFGPLRNDIAHRRWQKGERPDSIRAVGVDIRSGTAKWIVTETSRDWTLPELGKAGIDLAAVNDRVKTFHDAAGIAEIIERKDAERKAAKDS